MKYRLVSLIMALVLGAFAANAQAVLEVEAPNVVALGEPFNVVYTTDRNVDDFISPEFSSVRCRFRQCQTSTHSPDIFGKDSKIFSIHKCISIGSL